MNWKLPIARLTLLTTILCCILNLSLATEISQAWSKKDSPEGQQFLRHIKLARESLKSDKKLNQLYLDSAKHLVQRLNSDTAKLLYFTELTSRYQRIGEFDSLAYAGAALEKLAGTMSVLNFQARGAAQRGAAFYYTGNPDSAYSHYKRSTKLASKSGDSSMIVSSLLGEGLSLLVMEDYEKAIPIIQECSKISKRRDDLVNYGYAEYYWGYLLFKLNRKNEALKHFQNSLEVREKTNDIRGVSNCLISISAIEADNGNYQKAVETNLKVLPALRKIGNNLGIINAHEAIAAANYLQDEFLAAKTHVDSALYYSHKSGITTEIERIYLTQSQIALALKDYPLAQAAAEKVINKKVEKSKVATTIQALEIIGKSMVAQGGLDEGFAKIDRAIFLRDSLHNSEVDQEVMELEKKFELTETEITLAKKEAELAQKDLMLSKTTNRWIVALAACLLLVILFIFILVAYKAKSKAKAHQDKLNKELQVSNNKLKELNIEKNNLIGIVAHDLKSPFHNIIGLTDVFEVKSDLNAEQKRLLEMIRKSAYNVEDMINHILDLNKIESNLLNLDLSPVNLSGIAELIVERFQYTADRKKIKLKSEIDNTVYALANENYFNQVVENILSNAFKFSNQNTEVQLELKDCKDHVLLTVSDSGPGIAEEHKSKLFEPNVTGNATPTGNEKSTGIGLAIVKRFVDSMGGEVWFDSELGKGTKFYVKLQKAS